MNEVWPAVNEGMKAIGIIDMEIYLYENIAFMIMDTIDNFDHDQAMQKLSAMPDKQKS